MVGGWGGSQGPTLPHVQYICVDAQEAVVYAMYSMGVWGHLFSQWGEKQWN